ncbi:MAG: hypothetical protein QNK23_13330 [Crocinitomicaceae bacterium]|nr:hypothetical protein [Crocinitomicaceae bacterium]
MKHFILFTSIVVAVLISGCVAGNYTSEQSMATSSAQTCNSIAPMKLNSMKKVIWTRYAFTNSYANPYEEHAKWRRKGDTLYMRGAIYNGDDELESKIYTPSFLIQGDTLISLRADCSNYVKAK